MATPLAILFSVLIHRCRDMVLRTVHGLIEPSQHAKSTIPKVVSEQGPSFGKEDSCLIDAAHVQVARSI